MTATLPAWQVEPSVVLPAAVAAATYLYLYRRGAVDRPRTPWPLWRPALFLAGVSTVVLTLESPLDGLAETLFAAHMLQHMLLLVVAPPLLLLGLPARALLRALPRTLRRNVVRPLARNGAMHRAGQLLFHPLTVFCLFNGLLGFWHLPPVFAAAEHGPTWHALEHGTYLLAGCLLWWLIVEPLRVWPKSTDLSKMLFIIACHLPMLLLGQLFLAFATRPLYPFASTAAVSWGLTPLTDQRLGGAIMFGLDMLITFATVSTLFGRYLARLEREQVVRDLSP